MPKPKTAKKRAVKKSKNRLLLPYPLAIFLLICVGVLLVAWSLRANAQDVLVKAIVKGQPITGQAVITSPANNAHFTAVPITVDGSCPANAAYVEIFRNNLMSGSALCSGGKFELSIDLFTGRNDLIAHSFNVTDDEGPVSNGITIYYDQPPAPTGQGTPSTPASQPPSKTDRQLSLKTAFIYKGYYVGQEVQWPLEISGGHAPYALNIDWGDGSNSIISRKAPGVFDIRHTYKTAGGEKGSYVIKVQASDPSDDYAYLQFFVIVNSKLDSPAGGGSIYTKPPPSLGGLAGWLWLAWPAYLSVFLMVVGYKLGEREEILILRKRGALRN